jgi:uncharacterized protein
MLRAMSDLTRPLSDAELDRLDRLLLERIDEHAETEGRDEGVIGVSELDGFLTAIVSGPVTVQPSRWLPVLYGDFPPVWDRAEDAQAFLELLLRHMNEIVFWLLDEPEEFEPLYLESDTPQGPAVVVDEWCEGYLRGVGITFDEWISAPEIADLLDPIRAFTRQTNWLAHRLEDARAVDALRDAIVPNVVAIHAHWLAVRESALAPLVPFRREAPRVGRNDLCPCGSGKKYKKCCGA